MLFTNLLAIVPVLSNLALGYEVKVSAFTIASPTKSYLKLTRCRPLRLTPIGLTPWEPTLGLSTHVHSFNVTNGKA